LALAAALNDGENQFAILIAQGELRPQQVGSAQIAATEVRTVTAGAVDAV
jgi:hypothetical protein